MEYKIANDKVAKKGMLVFITSALFNIIGGCITNK